MGSMAKDVIHISDKEAASDLLPCWLVSAKALRWSLSTMRYLSPWCAPQKRFVGVFSQSPSRWQRHTQRNWVMSPFWMLSLPPTSKKSSTAIASH